MSATMKIQKIRSVIGRPEKHRRILESLGLRKIRQIRELPDTATTRGMVNKVSHLVRVLDE